MSKQIINENKKNEKMIISDYFFRNNTRNLLIDYLNIDQLIKYLKHDIKQLEKEKNILYL